MSTIPTLSTNDKANAEPAAQFGRVPYGLIAAGLVARMKPADVRVYLAIAAHVNRDTWEAHPSIDTLARLTGLSRKSVFVSIDRLEKELKALQVERGGGRAPGAIDREGRSNIYRLCTNGEPQGTPLTRGPTVNLEFTVSEPNGEAGSLNGEVQGVHTVKLEGLNGHPQSTPEQKNRENRIKNKGRRRCAAAAPPDHLTRGAVALWVDIHTEVIGVAPDPIDGKAAGIIRKLVRGLTGETDAKKLDAFSARVRAADPRGRPPWPFDQPNEFTIKTIAAHWDKLGLALRSESNGPTKPYGKPGEYPEARGAPILTIGSLSRC